MTIETTSAIGEAEDVRATWRHTILLFDCHPLRMVGPWYARASLIVAVVCHSSRALLIRRLILAATQGADHRSFLVHTRVGEVVCGSQSKMHSRGESLETALLLLADASHRAAQSESSRVCARVTNGIAAKEPWEVVLMNVPC